jgi:anti-sigma B factor antagonist
MTETGLTIMLLDDSGGTHPTSSDDRAGGEFGMKDYKCIRLSTRGSVSVVQLMDNKVIDVERIAQLGEELMSLANSPAGTRVLINLDNVRFLSSSAINKLIVLERRLTSNGGDLKLSNLSPEVEEVFQITQLNSVFDICATEDLAIETFDK